MSAEYSRDAPTFWEMAFYVLAPLYVVGALVAAFTEPWLLVYWLATAVGFMVAGGLGLAARK